MLYNAKISSEVSSCEAIYVASKQRNVASQTACTS